MLTAEQIAEFERRAASGEKPKHPGWQWNPLNRPFFNCDGAWELCHLRVYQINEKRTRKPTVFYLTGALILHGGHDLAYLPAAQLAAEHLLLESVRPLVEHLIEDAATKAAGITLSLMISNGATTSQAVKNGLQRMLDDPDKDGLFIVAKVSEAVSRLVASTRPVDAGNNHEEHGQ